MRSSALEYTVHDTHATVGRIEADLALVLDTARRSDPSLKALVLTGGFARGEGAMMEGRPQNDYDFVALRGLPPPHVSYEAQRAWLEPQLGLHVDLQPVWMGRLGVVPRSIFWYETALRGRVLWGDPSLLQRVRVRSPDAIARTEGLRLLVNRAAGLLLAEREEDPHFELLQSAKALLGALDAQMLARGEFPPSQRERWLRYQQLTADGRAPAGLAECATWLAWAFQFKVDPARASRPPPGEAWDAAAHAVLDAVPVALRHAGLPSLEAYARRDAALENLVFRKRAGALPGARRWARHATGHVRVATLAMLREHAGLNGGTAHSREHLAAVMAQPAEGLAAVALLERLRRATPQ
jgi:hypothetical protein